MKTYLLFIPHHFKSTLLKRPSKKLLIFYEMIFMENEQYK